jgi:hypothetical protein
MLYEVGRAQKIPLLKRIFAKFTLAPIQPRSPLSEILSVTPDIDGLEKSPAMAFCVIPAKAGIQSY